MCVKLAILGVVVVLSVAGSLRGEDKKDETEPSIWMKQKLTYTQRILNGLATEDYEMIAENAAAMKGLNRIESFVRGKTEGYRTQLKTFDFAVNELLRNSESKNLDGATLAFTQLTINCVSCHKELRKQ